MIFIKVALVNPYFPSVHKHKEGQEALGLLYLCAVVEKYCDVFLYDAFVDNMDEAQIAEEVIQLNPALVGLSLKFATAIDSTIKIVRELKQNGFKGVIVMGGNTATFLYERLLINDYTDIVVLHEGEETFYELVKLIKNCERNNWMNELKKIKGIAFKDNGGYIHKTKRRGFIKEIDAIAFPTRKFYDKYYRNTQAVYILSSRGCCYSCIYCSTSKMWGDRWRGRSPENIIMEIKEIIDKYPNITDFNFVDDNFMVSRKRAENFMDLVNLEKFDSLTFNFATRAEHIDKDFISALKSLGTKNLLMGIESGSQRVLKLLKRRYSPDEIVDKVGFAEKIGIKVIASFMIGLPFEELEDVNMTLELIKKIPASSTQCHIFTPFPGTPCYDNSEAYGIKLDDCIPEDISLDTGVYLSTPAFNKEQITLMHRKALSLIRQKDILKALKASALSNGVK